MNDKSSIELIKPDWQAPPNVVAFTTTRSGGVSEGGYESLNLADHVGDAGPAVAENRVRLAATQPEVRHWHWLEQIHGTTISKLDSSLVDQNLVQAPPTTADGSVCSTPQLACCVMTADCLPLFLCSRDGAQVGLVHVGWRGLVLGVIEAGVEAMDCPAEQLLAAFGPAIGPQHFEVGEDVLGEAVAAVADSASAAAVKACFKPQHGSGKFLADLPGLAELRLRSLWSRAAG